MAERKIRVGVNGYGVIGKRTADAVALQPDTELAGVADVAADWRLHVAKERGFPIFSAASERAAAMRAAGIDVAGSRDDLITSHRSIRVSNASPCSGRAGKPRLARNADISSEREKTTKATWRGRPAARERSISSTGPAAKQVERCG